MPVTNRARRCVVVAYEILNLDLALEMLDRAEQIVQERHGRRVTLRDLRAALRQMEEAA